MVIQMALLDVIHDAFGQCHFVFCVCVSIVCVHVAGIDFSVPGPFLIHTLTRSLALVLAFGLVRISKRSLGLYASFDAFISQESNMLST